MTMRPASYPFWTDGNPAKVTTPDGATALQGFTAGEPPPFQYVNYLFYTINGWINYLDVLTNTGLTNALMRLINGGNWSFSASTGVLSWSATANLAIPAIPDSSNAITANSVTLNDGDDAYCVANMPTTSLGDTNPSLYPDEIVNMNFTGNITVGMDVTGPGVPNGTTVLGVAAASVLLSANTTSDNTQQTYVFSNAGPITVLTSPNTSLIGTPSTILLARRAGNSVYLGVNCAQMVLRDGEFKTLNGSGYFSVYQAPAGQDLSAGTLVYASAGVSDGGRTTGALYPLDTSATNQAARGTYAGVVTTAVTTGNPANVVYSGFYTEVGLTPGVNYYADPTNPGGFTSTQPNGSGQKIVPVGYAVTATDMLFTGVEAGVANIVSFPVFNQGLIGYGNGAQTAFTLPTTPFSANSAFVFIGGVYVPASEYTIVGTTITFNAPPDNGVEIDQMMTVAAQGYARSGQEQCVDSGDHQTFTFSTTPLNQAATMAMLNGTYLPISQWTLVMGGTPSIRLNTALTAGTRVDVLFFY
jgi:hypothetical protein